MFKLDFSNLQENGFRINRLRLSYSSKFRGLSFMKNKQKFTDAGDVTGEKNFLLEYIGQKMEKTYTQYMVFSRLTFVGLFVVLMSFFVHDWTLTVRMIPLAVSFIFWFVAKKGKENFVMTHVGYGLAESIYDFKIKEKYNL